MPAVAYDLSDVAVQAERNTDQPWGCSSLALMVWGGLSVCGFRAFTTATAIIRQGTSEDEIEALKLAADRLGDDAVDGGV